MDLKLKEVSELLNVPQSKVKKWLLEGKIPAYKLDRQYLFSRIEIEDWVMKNGPNKADDHQKLLPLEDTLDDDEEVSYNGIQQFSLYRAINKGGVYIDVEGSTKEEIISWTTKRLAEKFHWDANVLADLLIDRETLMPTALNNGVGLPHTRDFLLDTHFDVITVVFPKNPIEYGALDGKPVHTLFFLFACEDKRHLNLIAKLAHLASQEEVLALLSSKPSQIELLSFIKDWENSLVKK